MDSRKIMPWVIGGLVLLGLAVMLVLPRGGRPLAASGSVAKADDISGAQLRQLVGSGAMLVDVRTPAEFAGGHIEGAVNVPVTKIAQVSSAWDKNKPIVVYCQTGARSLNASQFLKAQGFTHVYNLARGVSAWDGALVSTQATGTTTKSPATGRPTMYEFYSDT